MKEKPHRLRASCYTGCSAVAFTLCCENKECYFNDEKLIFECLNILKNGIDSYNVINWGYVFMPDHMHMILQGRETNANLLKLLNMFKQKTSYKIKNTINSSFSWQKSYYDHILRSEKELSKHIRYIAENPVRKGLIDDWKKYKYFGSLSFKE
ncbi:MAG: transposase [Candidatus Goldbacteria bacterium]|nr:transposase [Candidatus Goldiibacteriota bacterium]